MGERQAMWRQVIVETKERRKAAEFLVMDAVMGFCNIYRSRMQCLSCVSCSLDGLVSLNKIKFLKTKTECLVRFFI